MNYQEKELFVQKIHAQYTEKQHTPLDELKCLDARVKRPVNVFAYTFGALSAIIMGAGMSLIMTDLGAILGIANTMISGIIVGVVGMALALLTYPIYNKLLNARKKKFTPQILDLSEKVMKQ